MSAIAVMMSVGVCVVPAAAVTAGCATGPADFVPPGGSRWSGTVLGDGPAQRLDVAFLGRAANVRLSDEDYRGTVVFRLNLGWSVTHRDTTARFDTIGVVCGDRGSRVTEMSGTVAGRGPGWLGEPDRFQLRRLR